MGFWPPAHLFVVTDEERRLLPDNAAEMERRNGEARTALQAALDAAMDPSWKAEHPDEFAVVLAYLNTPDRVEDGRGFSRCRVCDCANGSQDWFKGPFRYPQGYVHYLVEHGFKPPQAMIDAALGR